jgi:hypothetical protein
MNRISGYSKTITEFGSPPQTEVWNFYYGLTGIEKATRKQNQIQNLTIDYSTDTKGRILSADYTETVGFNGNLTFVYDNLGNVCALTNNQGNIVTAYGYNVMNGVVESEFNPNSVENPFTFGGAVKIGNNDANVAPEGGSTFVVDPNLSAVTLGKNVIALGTGCFSEAIRDEMGRVIGGPSFEEVNEALRELAQRDGFAMWCPGQLCALTPCSAIINPEGCEEEDDDMYPDKVGRSRVDEKKFKKRSECLSYCSNEFKNTLDIEIGKVVTEEVIKLIIAILGAVVIAVLLPAIAAAIGLILANHIGDFFTGVAFGILISGIVKPYFNTHRTCIRYYRNHYKS